jgi:hypothetical protein
VSNSDTETDRLRRRVLGWAPALFPVEPWVGAGAGLDITVDDSRAEGNLALGQALTLALITLRGSDFFNTGFGFRGLSAIAEETDPVLKRERIRLAVIEVLRDEPRIRRIVAVRFPDELGDETGEPTVRPPPRVLAVEAEFETVAGEQQTVVLGGQVLDAG